MKRFISHDLNKKDVSKINLIYEIKKQTNNKAGFMVVVLKVQWLIQWRMQKIVSGAGY